MDPLTIAIIGIALTALGVLVPVMLYFAGRRDNRIEADRERRQQAERGRHQIERQAKLERLKEYKGWVSSGLEFVRSAPAGPTRPS